MTDKPFDHEEYSRERLQQTTPGDGSDFKGHLVHRPGRIEADQQTIAELQRSLEDLTPGGSEFVDNPANCIRFVRERLATAGKLAAERNAQRQTIADLRAETERWQEFANGYMRDLTAAEQTIAELRKVLGVGQRLHDWIDEQNPDGTEVVCNVCHAEGYDGSGLIHYDNCTLHQWRKALAAIAATEEDKPS